MTRTKLVLQFIGVPALGAFAVLRLVAGDWDAALVSMSAAVLLAIV